MITNVEYLIQRYAEAREKKYTARTTEQQTYYQGVADTYESLLQESFPGWRSPGTTGFFVSEGSTYDEAITKAGSIRKSEPKFDPPLYSGMDLDENGCEYDY